MSWFGSRVGGGVSLPRKNKCLRFGRLAAVRFSFERAERSDAMMSTLTLGPTTMPLVKLFARTTLTKAIPLPAIQQMMCDVWGTKPETTKLILTRVDDWTEDSFNEDVYVDIRAYGKAERTRDFVLDGMKTIQKNLKDEHELVVNVRLETYDGERYFHVPPPN